MTPGGICWIASNSLIERGTVITISRTTESSRIHPRGRLRSMARRSRHAAISRASRVRPGSSVRSPLILVHACSGSVVKALASSSPPSSSTSHGRRFNLSSCSSSRDLRSGRYRTSSMAYSICSADNGRRDQSVRVCDFDNSVPRSRRTSSA